MSGDYRILVAIDLKAGTDRLLAETQRFAKALSAIVDIIHVADPDPFIGYIKSHDPDDQSVIDSEREPRARAMRTEHRDTQTVATKLRDAGVRVDQALMIQGPTLEMILEEVGKLGTDLLILGSHHHGPLHRLWFGDTAADAAKKAPCALLVVPL